jgi:hypothetical protein
MQPIEPEQPIPPDFVPPDFVPSGLEPHSVEFVPLPKFRGRRYGYLLHNKVYVCPVLHTYLADPQHRHQALARLPILDVEAYFSEAASRRMKADIAAATQSPPGEAPSRGENR